MSDLAELHPRFTLVGRDRDVAILHNALAATRAGRGDVVLIGGEPGVGKTALAEVIARDAQRAGLLTLRGACSTGDATSALRLWIDLFVRYPLSPDALALPPAFAVRGTIGPVASQMELFAHMHHFLVALTARQPVFLLLEDIHWADADSLKLLRFLARLAFALPLLIVVTYRDNELTDRHPLAEFLLNLVREADPTRLTLRSLDPGDVGALVAVHYDLAAADAGRLIAYLNRQTGGNPFYLIELLRSLVDMGVLRKGDNGDTLGDLTRFDIPRPLQQLIGGRIGRLGTETQRLLSWLAIIGQEAPLALWATVAQVTESTLIEIVEMAERERLLDATRDGARVVFVHDLIREALYEAISASRRRQMHGAVGAVLAAERDPDPEATAYHFQRAGDARAVRWLVAAGWKARRAFAWTTAAQHFEAALPFLERETGQEQQRECAWLYYIAAYISIYQDRGKSLAYNEKAVALAVRTGERVLLPYARFNAGYCHFWLGAMFAGLRGMDAAVREIEAFDAADRQQADEKFRTDALPKTQDPLSTFVLHLAHVGRYREARARGEANVRRYETARWERQDEDAVRAADTFSGLAQVYAALGRPDEARAAYARAKDGYSAANQRTHVGLLSHRELVYVILPYLTDDLDARRQVAVEANDTYARDMGEVPIAAGWAYAQLDYLEGNWNNILPHIRAFFDAPAVHVGPRLMTVDIFNVCRYRSDAGTAWRAIERVLGDGQRREFGDCLFSEAVSAFRLAAALSLDGSTLADGRRWIELHTAWLEKSGAIHGRSEEEALWARYYRLAGDSGEAYAHARRALVHARKPRQPLALLAAHRLLGELATEANHSYRAAAHLRASFAYAARCRAPFERALTEVAHAELCLQQGEPEKARLFLHAARNTVVRLGAVRLLPRIETLLAQQPAMRGTKAAYPMGLTAREVEVLRLIAVGYSSKRIAAALCISDKTVNTHVNHIFGKTGAENRVQAVEFARKNGIVGGSPVAE